MVTIRNREMVIPQVERRIGIVSDNNSEMRTFSIPRYIANSIDLSALTFKLDLENENGDTNTAHLSREVLEDRINLTWTIIANDVSVSGTLLASIRATDGSGTVKWGSYKGAFYVESGVNTPERFSGNLSELEILEHAIDAVLSSEVGRVNAESTRASNEIQRIALAEQMQQAANSVINDEQARVAAENARVTAENTRKSAETSRATAETNRTKAEASRTTAEGARKSAEDTRTSEENTRKSSEASRVTAETARASAENTRVDQENSRKSAETARVTEEGKRVTAEKSRATVENTRVSQENSRKTAETARATAESTRVNQENSRKSAETARATAESTRVSQENSRKSAEMERATAEGGRVAAETARVSAENARKALATNMESATGRANTAAQTCEDLADGILPVATPTKLGGIKSAGDIKVNADGSVTIPSLIALQALIDDRIQKSMIAHVLNSANANMVLGADQGPQITSLIDTQKARIDQLNSNLMNRLTVDKLPPSDALNYVDKNYDITVGVDADLFGIGSVGHGYFYNRKSGIYNLQHFYSLKDGAVYDRVIGETGGNRQWSKIVSNSDLKITNATIDMGSDNAGPYMQINGSNNVSFLLRFDVANKALITDAMVDGAWLGRKTILSWS